MIDMKYWKTRAIELEHQTNQSSKESYKKLIPVFNKAQKEIQDKIDIWLTRIADNNSVSLDRAKEILDKKELKDFKMSLNEYIDYGIDNAFSQKWIKELENASARVHIDRLEQLKISLQAEAIRLFGTEDNTLIESIKKAYNERYNQNNYIVQKGLGIGFDIVDINQDKLDKLIVKPWVNDGRNFSNHLWQSKEQMVNNLYNQTVRLCLGGNLKEVIDSMTKYLNSEIKNKKYAAQRLIQTEMSYFTAEAQKMSYTELGLEKYEIVATLDNKTSSICQEMDGKVYDMKAYQSGVTAPPFHPNCRATTCHYFDDEFTIGEMWKAKDLEGKTYKVPATMSYREWKTEQEIQFFTNKYSNIIEFNNLTKEEIYNIIIDIQKYGLFKSYAEAINKNNLQKNVLFSDYNGINKEARDKLIGIKTSDGITVTDIRNHVTERIIGNGTPSRKPYKIQDIINTLKDKNAKIGINSLKQIIIKNNLGRITMNNMGIIITVVEKMINLNEKQKIILQPTIKNLDNYLINDKAEELVDEICFYFCDISERPYTDEECAIEDVMDYINSTYCCNDKEL